MSDMTKLRNLEIDQTKLDEELCTQASNFLFVAEKSVELETKYLAAKLQHDTLCAQLDGEIRVELDAKGQKATEKIVEAQLLLNEKYQSSAKNLNIIRAQKETIKALKEAWAMRKDLLIRVAINQRTEIEGLMSSTVKEREAA